MTGSRTEIPSTTGVTTGVKPVRVKRSSRNLRRMIAIFENIKYGTLEIVLPSGRLVTCKGSGKGPEASLIIKDADAADHVFSRGAIGAADAYMSYDWDSPDLVALLELMARNRSAFEPLMQGGTLYRLRNRIRQKLHLGGSKGRARRFAGHYELPNRFFECWLDPEMVYSAATYGLGNDLAAAQKAKLHRICTQLGLKEGMKLLEINCGWGSLSVLAARDYGCEVTALTLSETQLETCRLRAHGHRQDNKVDFRLEDFSAITGTYDRIISVEPFGMMTEADWPNFFATISGHLAEDGLAYVETTTIRDELFDGYRNSLDPVREYIFPGSLLPSYGILDDVVRDAGLTEAGYADIGGTYVPTLKVWQRRFQTMWPEIMMLGFDNDFKRSWELFLAYAEAGFRTGDLTLREMLLAKGETGTSD